MRFYAHSLARPKRVAKALRKELAAVDIAASLPVCQDAVAEMYGYAHWREMAADIGRHTPSVEDSAIDAATIAARRSRHVEALVKRFSGFAGRRQVAKKIIDAITPTGAFVDNTRSSMIRAECHLSDYSATVKFDAVPWFEEASDEDILDWLDDQLAGFSYKGIMIAWKMRKLVGYEPLLAYKDRAEAVANAEMSRSDDGQIITSDVRVHIPDAARWLREHRPEVFTAAAAVAKEHKTNLEVDYVPPWEGDARWPDGYCALQPEARQARDQVMKTFVRPVGVPREVRGFLNIEWFKGVLRLAVVRDGDRRLVVREWFGAREVAELKEEDVPAVERMSPSAGVYFQNDAREAFGRQRAVANITKSADGAIRVDFSRGLVLPQTLENLGITDCALIDRVLLRRNGLIVVAGPTGSGKTTTLLSLVRRWQTALQPARPSAKTMALLADPTYRGPLPVEGQTVYAGELRDQKSLERAVSFAASAPVVAVMHAYSITEALQWLLKLHDNDPASLSGVLAGIISVNLSRSDDSEFDEHLLRSAGMQPRRVKMRSEAAMFATPEESATFVAQYSPAGGVLLTDDEKPGAHRTMPSRLGPRSSSVGPHRLTKIMASPPREGSRLSHHDFLVIQGTRSKWANWPDFPANRPFYRCDLC